jgi:hypothetical protein
MNDGTNGRMIESDLDPIRRPTQSCLYHKIYVSTLAPHALIHLYVRTVKPPLVEPCDIDAYVIALAIRRVGIPEEGGDTKGRSVRRISEWYVSRMFLSLISF